MSHDEVLEGIDDLPWTELSSCHDAAPVPGLFRQVAEGNRRSLVAAEQILQIVWYQGSLFEATIPAARSMADLAASDLRPDVRALLVSYLLLFGHGTTFVEPSGGRSFLDPAEFAERFAAERLVVDEVRRIVTTATDGLLGQLETAPSEVREALLGLAHLGSQPLPKDTLERLHAIVGEVPPDKRTAAQLVLDHLEANPIRVDLVEQEWRDLSDGEDLLEHARRGEFTEQDWTTLISQMAGRLCTTPLDRDGLWARAQLFGDGDLLSVDEAGGPTAAGRHCVRRADDGGWRVFYDDGGEVRFERACRGVAWARGDDDAPSGTRIRIGDLRRRGGRFLPPRGHLRSLRRS